ncbi:MAG: hypothetical protein PHV37_01380 [Candidatus Gastranaerophilales bacterium]|nr:hypothetical protein [Candidatus Gastranaerophilales bacterium]
MLKKAVNPYISSEIYVSQNNSISDSIMQNWTPQAIECYKINSNCKKCSVSSGHYSFVCKMPDVIEHLVDSIGKPSIC